MKAEIVRENVLHTGNELYICFDNNTKISSTYKSIEAQFEVKHFFFDSLHQALDNLPDEIIIRLLPNRKSFTGQVRAEGISALKNIRKEYTGILKLMNMEEDHQYAFQVALSCQSNSPPVLISGAFGSGKTCFLASVAYCFISEAERCKSTARVLICAHHPATADTILNTYFGPMLTHRTAPLEVKVVQVIPNGRTVRGPYSAWCKQISDFKKVAQNYCEISKLVIITTFMTSIQLKKFYRPGFFTHIMIDEGAQAREPEAIAPLCLADRNTKIIIAGDEKQVSFMETLDLCRYVSLCHVYFACTQVGPALLVLGDAAREHGFKLSLLERLQDLYRNIGDRITTHVQATLQTNYRCHIGILKFASELFYNSFVTVKESQKSKEIKSHPNFSCPLLFICSTNEEIKHYELNKNINEAQLLLNTLYNILTQWQKADKNMDVWNGVCILSSSRGQVSTNYCCIAYAQSVAATAI